MGYSSNGRDHDNGFPYMQHYKQYVWEYHTLQIFFQFHISIFRVFLVSNKAILTVIFFVLKQARDLSQRSTGLKEKQMELSTR